MSGWPFVPKSLVLAPHFRQVGPSALPIGEIIMFSMVELFTNIGR